MQTSFSMRWPHVARRALAPLVLLLSMLGLAVAAANPAPVGKAHALAGLIDDRRQEVVRAITPARTVVVWRGQDVDGDGAADFANPTGRAPRAHDGFGDGSYGARRDGGARSHEGVDYRALADQAVRAPISGYVTKIGFAYAGDDSLRFVEITNPAIGYVARAFYVRPEVAVGDVLRLGDRIGSVASLQSHYPGITDHVHLEVMGPSGVRLDATNLIRPVKMVQRGNPAANKG